METINEKTIGKYRIKIYPDECAESPDNWGNDETFVVFDHRDFYVERDGFKPRDIWEYMLDNPNKVLYNGYFVIQCYAYIHGGVALSVGGHNFPDARWDVSSTGFWLVKRQKGTWTRAEAIKSAESLCKVWNQFLMGDVYGYEIVEVSTCDHDCEHETQIDSCWGYYGQDECMKEAESLVKHYIEQDNLETVSK